MSEQAPGEPFKRIGSAEARELLQRGDAKLIDVREQWEWNKDHIAGATLIPLGQILAQPQEHLNSDNVIFHCAVGARSAVAAEVAASLGFKNLYNLEGGIDAWRAAGLPVEK